jgi:hypothetical protein
MKNNKENQHNPNPAWVSAPFEVSVWTPATGMVHWKEGDPIPGPLKQFIPKPYRGKLKKRDWKGDREW